MLREIHRHGSKEVKTLKLIYTRLPVALLSSNNMPKCDMAQNSTCMGGFLIKL